MARLLLDYYDGKSENEITGLDIDIIKYITQCCGDYDQILADDGRWQVFYHLSSMREAVLAWLDFEKRDTVLEINGGFGAITGTLCRIFNRVDVTEAIPHRAEAIKKRYEKYDNLNIYQCNLEDFQCDSKYDYVIWIGGLEKCIDCEQMLGKVKSFLKEEGKLILAVENRLGIKYFCGYPDKYTGKPFSGINNKYDKTNGRCFARSEIDNIIKNSGLIVDKVYYPMPDYVIPQVIMSDDYQPAGLIKERVINYYHTRNTLIADEKVMIEEVVKGGALGFLNNSFIFICSEKKQDISIKGAIISIDREKTRSYTTIIFDNKVIKNALTKEAQIGIKDTYVNLLELRSRGLNTVDFILQNEKGIMPFMEFPSGMDYLRSIIDDETRILRFFDEIYDDVKKSSDMTDKYSEVFNSYTSNLVLKKGYLDMVPMNMFIANGERVYFDQEFCIEGCPIEYIMFRTIRYSYLICPKIENVISLEKVLVRYGLDGMWNSFMSIENSFVANNRKHDIYKHLIAWSSIDENEIDVNIKRLCGY